MMKGFENKALKINKPVGGYPAGAVIKIKVDSAGVPVKKYWRDRLKDAARDECVEFVQSEPVKKSKKEVAKDAD
jgi:hypothetical protein